MALLLVLSWLGFQQAMKQPSLRVQFDAAFLKLPILGRLATGYNTARFASTLAMLTGAGVPILKALQSAADTLSNQALRADALQAEVLVREGAPLAQALAYHRRLPSLLPMFVRQGEQTGRLPEMLQRCAEQLGNDVQRRAMQLATVLEPLLIVPVISATADEAVARPSESQQLGLATTPEGDIWFSTVQRLLQEERITALVRELALQSQLVAIDEAVTPHHWLLRIERESLNQGPTRERLVAALSEAGVSVTLGVELGLVQDTPAKRIAFANAERLEAARHVMMNDPFVEQMMRDFGGTIVPGTLKPVDAA